MSSPTEESIAASMAVLERLLALATRDQAASRQLGEDVRAAARQLEAQTKQLVLNVDNQVDALVARHVEQLVNGISAKLKNTFNAAEEARDAYGRAATSAKRTIDAAAKRTIWGLVAVGGLCLAFVTLLILWYLPSAGEIQERRTEILELKAQAEALRAVGGDSVVARCDGQPCVQVLRTKVYGDGADYYVLAPKRHP